MLWKTCGNPEKGKLGIFDRFVRKISFLEPCVEVG